MHTTNQNTTFSSHSDKEELIYDIKKLFYEIVNNHASEEEKEKAWLLKHCTPDLFNIMSDMTIVMLHVLDAVGRLEPINSINISKDTAIPKGTVSKSIPKLIAKKLIIKEPLPNNKKEFLFRITPLGKELFVLHQIMHKQIESKVIEFLNNRDRNELQLISHILGEFNQITWFESKE